MKELHGVKVESKLEARKNKLGVHKRLNPTAFKGYPGLEHTAKQICEFIPKCNIFVEPFAGLGRISKRVKADRYVLNDKSDYAFDFLTKNFNAEITNLDYSESIKLYDSENTYFFIDPPWYDEVYDVNPLTAFTKPCKEIYEDLESILSKIKGNWMIAGKADGVLAKWNYNHKEIKSRKNYLFGHKARTYLVSNLPFTNHWQMNFTVNKFDNTEREVII